MTERNADPEIVALAILDACERAARGFPVDCEDLLNRDAQFIAGSVKNWQTRIKVLKLQAAAGWRPAFQKILEEAHSICIEEISYPQKEAVRTQKMRCMACGRWEKRCKYGLNVVGPFQNQEFNEKGASKLASAWNSFRENYEATLSYSSTEKKLLDDDMGLYSIGETCMRKAQVYYLLNTLLLNEIFEAYYKSIEMPSFPNAEWLHATEDHSEDFLERFQQLQACAADDKRCIPSWGTDEKLWKKVNDQRNIASDGNTEMLAKMLRARAESHIGTCHACDDSGSESESEITRANRNRKTTRKRAAALEESDSDSGNLSDFIVDDDVEDEGCREGEEGTERWSKKRAPRRKTVNSARKNPRAGVRKSRRVMGKSPDVCFEALHEQRGPCEEGVASERIELSDAEEVNAPASFTAEAPPPEPPPEPTSPSPRISRKPPPNPFRVAQARRAPNGRLPARRECLLHLVELQLQLIRKGQDGDASICTDAIMTIQELMARVEQLSHTA